MKMELKKFNGKHGLFSSLVLLSALGVVSASANAQIAEGQSGPVDKQIKTQLFGASSPKREAPSVLLKTTTFSAVSSQNHQPHEPKAKAAPVKKESFFEKLTHLGPAKHPVAENKPQHVKSQPKIAAVTHKKAVHSTSRNHKVSLNFQNIKTRMLLQLLAKTSDLNFIISENVTGSMTLHVKNIPWQQALDIILKANGLDSRRFGDVLLIAPIKEMAENEINALTARQQVEALAPLRSEILRLNYASAADIASILRSDGGSILSARGQVGIDSRTNSLWLRDLEGNIGEIKHFVNILDVPAQQVLIEARIVSVDKKFERDLGVRFGVSRPGRLSGKLLRADGSSSANDAVSAIDDRLLFNIPSTMKNAASLALSLVHLGGKNFLDLELSALEKENHAETISTPRLITSNQKEALIEEGEEIPYLAASSSGSTSVEFKKAVLSLKITPQITPDRNIVLQLHVTQDTRGDQIQLNAGTVLPPAINTKEVDSHVFLRNGQTVVIGGIYQRTSSNLVHRVPFLGKLPIVGNLFRQKSRMHENKELLVFITPRIIDRGYLGPKHVHLTKHDKCCD